VRGRHGFPGSTRDLPNFPPHTAARTRRKTNELAARDLFHRAAEKLDLERARFELFRAFEGAQEDDAERWSAAVRAGLLTYEVAGPEESRVHQLALEALDRIDLAITEE
jgi:hypothetical protein